MLNPGIPKQRGVRFYIKLLWERKPTKERENSYGTYKKTTQRNGIDRRAG